MGKRLTYEVINKKFAAAGYTLIDTEYIGNSHKLNYVCNNGHKSSVKYSKFRSGNRCRACNGTEKLNIEYVKKELLKKGYTLLDDKYINSSTKLNLICKNGHKIKMPWNTIQQGSDCKLCSNEANGKSQALTYESVYNKFKERGFELLEHEYRNNRIPMLYKCSCGNISKKSYSNLLAGQNCEVCRIVKISGKNNYQWNDDRTITKRLNCLKFRKRNINILNDDIKYDDYLINSKRYEIDHIFPRIAFIDNDLDKKYDPVIIKEICNLRENLRIIPKEENGSKGGRYNQDEFMAWFNEKINVYNLKGNINANCKDYAIDKSVGCCNNQHHAGCSK